MSDLISRQAALAEIDKNRDALLSSGMTGAEHILVHYGRRVIEELPTIEPKKGKWVEDEYWDYKCSACGKGIDDEIYLFMPYCPNCGARMEGESDG